MDRTQNQAIQALETLIAAGLEQTVGYMDRVGDVREGHFILFNRDPKATWDEKIWHRREQWGGYEVMGWSMYVSL